MNALTNFIDWLIFNWWKHQVGEQKTKVLFSCKNSLTFNSDEFALRLIREGNTLLTESFEEELKARKESVSNFLHESLPVLNENYENLVVLEGAKGVKANYGLIMGRKPEYDFIMPEIPLYLCVRGPASADWSTAQTFGITRDEWEQEQAYIDGLISFSEILRDEKRRARLIVFRWGDPVNHLSLLKIFEAIK